MTTYINLETIKRLIKAFTNNSLPIILLHLLPRTCRLFLMLMWKDPWRGSAVNHGIAYSSNIIVLCLFRKQWLTAVPLPAKRQKYLGTIVTWHLCFVKMGFQMQMRDYNTYPKQCSRDVSFTSRFIQNYITHVYGLFSWKMYLEKAQDLYWLQTTL